MKQTWCSAPEVGVKRNFTKYTDNVWVGPAPYLPSFTREEADFFDIYINVGDNLYEFAEDPSRQGQVLYWYPLNELGMWPLSTLFAIFHILDRATVENKKVYVHCAAGAYRSPQVVQLWLASKDIDNAKLDIKGIEHVDPCFTKFCKHWRANQAQGLQYSFLSTLMQKDENNEYITDSPELFIGKFTKRLKG